MIAMIVAMLALHGAYAQETPAVETGRTERTVKETFLNFQKALYDVPFGDGFGSNFESIHHRLTATTDDAKEDLKTASRLDQDHRGGFIIMLQLLLPENATVTHIAVRDGKATVTLQTRAPGNPGKGTLGMVLEENQWKIDFASLHGTQAPQSAESP